MANGCPHPTTSEAIASVPAAGSVFTGQRLVLGVPFEDELDAAVVGATLAGRVVGNWASFTDPAGLQATGRLASVHEVAAHGVCPAL